jgi:hypothetical protein
MFGWAHLLSTPTELGTVEAVRDWLATNAIKAKAEARSDESVAVTTHEGQATVFRLPVPVGSLRWILQGQP